MRVYNIMYTILYVWVVCVVHERNILRPKTFPSPFKPKMYRWYYTAVHVGGSQTTVVHACSQKIAGKHTVYLARGWANGLVAIYIRSISLAFFQSVYLCTLWSSPIVVTMVIETLVLYVSPSPSSRFLSRSLLEQVWPSPVQLYTVASDANNIIICALYSCITDPVGKKKKKHRGLV